MDMYIGLVWSFAYTPPPLFYHLRFLDYKYEEYVAFACTYASILIPERYHLVYVQ
jgi:hypothetical protein